METFGIMSSSNQCTNQCNESVSANDDVSIDNIMKGIVEGMIFLIPDSSMMPKGDHINVNGVTASRLKIGENTFSVNRADDSGEKLVTLKIVLDRSPDQCKINFFVYDLDNLVKNLFFGIPSHCVLKYLDMMELSVTHRCKSSRSNVSNQQIPCDDCDCVRNLQGQIVECTKVTHTITKESLIKCVKNIYCDLRSASCVKYTKHGKLVDKIIANPSLLDHLSETVNNDDESYVRDPLIKTCNETINQFCTQSIKYIKKLIFHF